MKKDIENYITYKGRKQAIPAAHTKCLKAVPSTLEKHNRDHFMYVPSKGELTFQHIEMCVLAIVATMLQNSSIPRWQNASKACYKSLKSNICSIIFIAGHHILDHIGS